MTVTLCLSRSLVLLNQRPRAHSSGPKGPFGLMWLSLPHFVYNSVLSSTQLPLARWTQFNYIIVQRPLDLCNRMFNHHQAEITVMQFRGHSLPVHHSVVYHGNYLVPFHQPISAHAISSPNCHWNVSLPSGASPWNSIFLGRVEGQNITSLFAIVEVFSQLWRGAILGKVSHANIFLCVLQTIIINISSVKFIWFIKFLLISHTVIHLDLLEILGYLEVKKIFI